jgi:hypothetical protein
MVLKTEIHLYLFFETSKQIKKFSRQNLRLPVRVQTACFLSFFDEICVGTSTYNISKTSYS